MKDCYLTTLFSLGEASVCYESVTLLNICLPIYSNRSSGIRQPLKDERLYLSFKGCLGTLCLGLRRKSLLRSLRNLRCLLISERCIFNTVISIAWFDLPVRPIHLFFCDHLFQFVNCQRVSNDLVSPLLIDVKNSCHIKQVQPVAMYFVFVLLVIPWWQCVQYAGQITSLPSTQSVTRS